MQEQINIEITGENSVAVVAFTATSISNAEGIAAAAKQVRQLVEEHQPKKLVFDFQRVKFFSSQVLGLLLDTRAKIKDYNGEVLISAINPQLHRVFKITNLDKIFRFFPNRESAIQAEGPN